MFDGRGGSRENPTATAVHSLRTLIHSVYDERLFDQICSSSFCIQIQFDRSLFLLRILDFFLLFLLQWRSFISDFVDEELKLNEFDLISLHSDHLLDSFCCFLQYHPLSPPVSIPLFSTPQWPIHLSFPMDSPPLSRFGNPTLQHHALRQCLRP